MTRPLCTSQVIMNVKEFKQTSVLQNQFLIHVTRRPIKKLGRSYCDNLPQIILAFWWPRNHLTFISSQSLFFFFSNYHWSLLMWIYLKGIFWFLTCFSENYSYTGLCIVILLPGAIAQSGHFWSSRCVPIKQLLLYCTWCERLLIASWPSHMKLCLLTKLVFCAKCKFANDTKYCNSWACKFRSRVTVSHKADLWLKRFKISQILKEGVVISRTTGPTLDLPVLIWMHFSCLIQILSMKMWNLQAFPNVLKICPVICTWHQHREN